MGECGKGKHMLGALADGRSTYPARPPRPPVRPPLPSSSASSKSCRAFQEGWCITAAVVIPRSLATERSAATSAWLAVESRPEVGSSAMGAAEKGLAVNRMIDACYLAH